MKSKRLNEKELKKLIGLTWLELLVIGVVIYFFTDPLRVPVLLAGPIAIHALINFWVKTEHVGSRVLVQSTFLPMAFFTGIAALLLALICDKIVNSCTIALAVVCVLCIMVVYPESKCAYYDGVVDRHKRKKNPLHYYVADFS